MGLRWRLRNRNECWICSNYYYGRYKCTCKSSSIHNTGPLSNENFKQVFYLIDWKFEVEYQSHTQVWQVHDLISEIFGVDRSTIELYSGFTRKDKQITSPPLDFNSPIEPNTYYYFKLCGQKTRYQYELNKLYQRWNNK